MFSMNTDFYNVLQAEMHIAIKYANLPYVTIQISSSGKDVPFVKKKPPAPVSYPLVVLSEISNSHDFTTVDRRQVISALGYELEITSNNRVVGTTTYDNLEICRELAKILDAVMFAHRFRRLSLTPTPVVDTTLARIVGRYTGRMFNNYNQIL